MQNMALPDEVKCSLYKTMNVFFKPILHNKNVLALMFLMVIFAQEETEYDQGVGNMLSQYWILLRRHLTNTNCEDIEENLSYLSSCLLTLPALLQDNSDSLQEVISLKSAMHS
jgi:hypothetical protein